MNKLKRWFQSRPELFATALILLSLTCAGADDFALTKKLIGPVGGVNLQGGSFALSFAWGETASGHTLNYTGGLIESGYYGGRFGAGQTFSVLSTQVGGPPGYFQNGLQIGVTVQAVIQIVFSDQLDPISIPVGVTATLLQDHLSNPQNQPIALDWDYDPAGETLYVKPISTWQGNAIYDVAIIPGLESVSGYAIAISTHIRFLTMADPHEENIITNALAQGSSVSLAPGPLSGSSILSVEMAPESLPDYSVYLFNTTPMQTPWRADPAIMQEATRKAQAAGGAYRTPVGFLEVAAYSPEGKLMNMLTQPAHISIAYGNFEEGAPALARASSLSLWTLDPEHRLWVKIPASAATGTSVTAPITRLSVFALMGDAVGSASDVFVFPTPWRPAGPNAGEGAGQTGTPQGGMTFNNLPSECTIKIYTLNGDGVRTLHHSDTKGPVAQEKWDVNTSGGAHAASGVYLWRVESSQDSKNGKLMVIR